MKAFKTVVLFIDSAIAWVSWVSNIVGKDPGSEIIRPTYMHRYNWIVVHRLTPVL